MSTPMFRRALDLARAAATLELPFRSIEDAYTEVPPTDGPIPNAVYQTWVEPRVGRSHAAAVRRFRRMNPDHSFVFFDTAAMDEYMASAYADHPILEVYRKTVEGPAQTDIWRYCILLDRGGWYFDINKMVEAPLASFLDPTTQAVVALEDNEYFGELSERVLERFGSRWIVSNWGLGFAPGHPILRRTVDGIVAAYPEQRGVVQADLKEAIVHFTGPHRLTRAVADTIDAGEDEGLRIAGQNFEGKGVYRIPRSWVRYLQRSSYKSVRDSVMVR
ncbi:MAG: glycosyltransferase [Planctomycetota bacterium]